MPALETQPARTTDSIAAIKGEDFGYTQARHLLLRAGFGGTDEQIRTLARWGPEKSVDHLVNYEKINADEAGANAFKKDIIRPLTREERLRVNKARKTGDEDTLAIYRSERQRRQREDRRQMRDIQRAWITRMIESPRPLEEKMTLFWHGHFATSFRGVEDSYHMYAQNRLFRGNAMGDFGSLLRGIIRDPAMLKYLNNNQNRKDSPNENLGRELLELFSLGEGHYTERDVKEAARTLTGFTFADNKFRFNQGQHDQGSKFVLGVSGNIDGNSLVSAILNQEACALFIVLKLYRFFVRDIPMDLSAIDTGSRKAILRLAQMFRLGNYEIRPVIRKLLLSRHFYDSVNIGSKIKSPCELLIGSARSLRVPVRDIGIVTEAMELMGQAVFLPPSVKGWDGGRSWINTSTMFVRQNTLIYLLTGVLPTRPLLLKDQGYFDALALVPSLNTPGDSDPSDEQIVRELAMVTLGQASDDVVDSVLAGARGELGEGAMRNNEVVVRALVMLTSMPEYQLC
ncbi:MAG: DUF1800 domain-containing protein [Phycisphaerales bacterium]|nr:DUF1800 domain-containing protein [Phycisphaerales bacterium]